MFCSVIVKFFCPALPSMQRVWSKRNGSSTLLNPILVQAFYPVFQKQCWTPVQLFITARTTLKNLLYFRKVDNISFVNRNGPYSIAICRELLKMRCIQHVLQYGTVYSFSSTVPASHYSTSSTVFQYCSFSTVVFVVIHSTAMKSKSTGYKVKDLLRVMTWVLNFKWIQFSQSGKMLMEAQTTKRLLLHVVLYAQFAV